MKSSYLTSATTRMFSLLVILSLLSSCQQENIDASDSRLVDVSVNFSDLMSVDVTRASTKTANEASVKRIKLAIFNSDGSLYKDTIQNKNTDPDNFGQTINLRVPIGTYKFVAVAHNVAKADDATVTINSATEASLGTQTKLDSTYSTVQDVTLSGNTSQAVTIDFGTRRNAKLMVMITDATPSDVQKMELIVSPTASDYTDLKFNPSTVFATSTWCYHKVIDKTESSVTTFTDKNLTLGFLITGTTQTADITINALSADNTVLYTRTLSNVSFQQGHITKASGTFFSPATSSSFVFDTTATTDNIKLD